MLGSDRMFRARGVDITMKWKRKGAYWCTITIRTLVPGVQLYWVSSTRYPEILGKLQGYAGNGSYVRTCGEGLEENGRWWGFDVVWINAIHFSFVSLHHICLFICTLTSRLLLQLSWMPWTHVYFRLFYLVGPSVEFLFSFVYLDFTWFHYMHYVLSDLDETWLDYIIRITWQSCV